MSTSFVHIGERGFWMKDIVSEIWLRLLALHIEGPKEPGTVAGRVRDRWLFASRGRFGGCNPHDLERALSTPERERVVRDAIGSLLDAVRNAP